MVKEQGSSWKVFDVPSSSRLSTCPACCGSALSSGNTVDARLDMDRVKWEYEREKGNVTVNMGATIDDARRCHFHSKLPLHPLPTPALHIRIVTSGEGVHWSRLTATYTGLIGTGDVTARSIIIGECLHKFSSSL